MSLKKAIFLTFALSILLGATAAIIPGCNSSDKGTTPVEFTYPHVYEGTYRVVNNWQQVDSTWTLCYATFSFEPDYTFHMWIDSTEAGADFDACSVEGSYQFSGDSIAVTITNFNLYQDVCSPDMAPDAEFRYMVDGDYIVFECREDPPYRKIEIYGR